MRESETFAMLRGLFAFCNTHHILSDLRFSAHDTCRPGEASAGAARLAGAIIIRVFDVPHAAADIVVEQGKA